MKASILKGIGFGLTSGIITTLGLIIGLDSGTHSKSIIISGILIIAVADALSDSLGMHISEESNSNNHKKIWAATITTFLAKLIFSLSFLIPIIFLELSTAITISIIWGVSLITLFSYYIAKKQNEEPYKVVGEHLAITIVVIILTHYIGYFVALII